MFGFCKQNSGFRTGISSLNGTQTSPTFFAFKTATLAPELQVSMGPSPHLWFCTFTTATLWPEWIVSTGPRPHLSLDRQKSTFSTRISSLHGSRTSPVVLCKQNNVISIRNTCLYGTQPSSVVFACKTTWLASEILVSMGLSPHLWFLHAKQRILDQNYKSLWVPDFTVDLVMQKGMLRSRMTLV